MVGVPRSLTDALAEIRALLLDQDLVRAVGAGRRRGEPPALSRVELRPVDLKAGRRLQVVERTQSAATTRNLDAAEAPPAVDALLARPFGSWHVESATSVVQLRVTKRGDALVHRTATSRRDVVPRGHDRAKQRLLDADDPLFDVLGADADKRRQVDAFLRLLAPAVRRAASTGALPDGPMHVVDLGCGNAYLTFAAHRYLGQVAPGTRTTGVELRENLVLASGERAARAGLEGLSFTPGSIAEASPPGRVDVVLALHACDTATDEALARAVRWRAPVVLAAPCCHHDVQRQLAAARAGAGVPEPYGAIARHPILRERFADVLTDALRASLLRMLGYRTDVVEFVDSRHTPRNAMIRAVRTGAPPSAEAVAEYLSLTRAWSITPALATMLEPELAAVL
jgi:SAM-dependent methyltransferase